MKMPKQDISNKRLSKPPILSAVLLLNILLVGLAGPVSAQGAQGSDQAPPGSFLQSGAQPQLQQQPAPNYSYNSPPINQGQFMNQGQSINQAQPMYQAQPMPNQAQPMLNQAQPMNPGQFMNQAQPMLNQQFQQQNFNGAPSQFQSQSLPPYQGNQNSNGFANQAPDLTQQNGVQQGMVQQNQNLGQSSQSVNSNLPAGWTADFPSMDDFNKGNLQSQSQSQSQTQNQSQSQSETAATSQNQPSALAGTGAVAAGIGSALVRGLGAVMAAKSGYGYGSPYGMSPYGMSPYGYSGAAMGSPMGGLLGNSMRMMGGSPYGMSPYGMSPYGYNANPVNSLINQGIYRMFSR
jgi:hypothetical protein